MCQHDGILCHGEYYTMASQQNVQCARTLVAEAKDLFQQARHMMNEAEARVFEADTLLNAGDPAPSPIPEPVPTEIEPVQEPSPAPPRKRDTVIAKLKEAFSTAQP